MKRGRGVERRPGVLAGKPVVRGTRIPVELLAELVEAGWTVEQILREYPTLTREDIEEALEAARLLRAQRREAAAAEA
ncbi:MAG: DUF433 domain-containing protein [Crenarchaeota archaeon]|nr:DUF433 domain-containing protein [Thermoproteota archaeon]